MPDQASQLRHLVLRAARQREAESSPPPRMVAVVGARPGVGTTTIAAHLAKAIVQQGDRVVAIDADPVHRNLAQVCGVTDGLQTYDASIARHDIHEALLRAPGGVQVVPGVWDEAEGDPGEKLAQQLMRQFQQLGRHADLLVLDLGSHPSALLAALSDAAETILLVTSPDDAAVMDAYTLIKQSLATHSGYGLQLLVNQSSGESQARDVFHRVDRSCRRFLGTQIHFAGYLPSSANLIANLSNLAVRLSEGESHKPPPPQRVA